MSPARIRPLLLSVLRVAGTTSSTFCGTSKIAFLIPWRPDTCFAHNQKISLEHNLSVLLLRSLHIVENEK
jgi:hypothetical protein